MNEAIREVLDEAGLPPLPEPLAYPIVDCHTHLDTVQDVAGIEPAISLAAAREVGVTRIAQIGCDVEGSEFAEELARTHHNVIAAVAIHPNDAVHLGRAKIADTLKRIDELASTGDHVRAIGETGIDHFGTTDAAGHALQREVFAAHIAMAHAHGLTLAIHMRDARNGGEGDGPTSGRQAHDDVVDILNAEGWPDRVIMHCYSGDAELARVCLDHGAYLSFSGTITFNSAGPQRQALAIAPDDRILVETDAPFLTPAPRRGKRNGPYLLPYTARFVAQQRGWDEVRACQQFTDNAFAAYGGAW
ncbi:TatD family deoxyribonuclease [Cutibacterium sp. WCA-380-WT-3A]|uniref:TatD family deoxyribonuclease n=1 Tax=Cutibacterium porci TaxID=2605781 RepID=A0A7K0J5F6_9ACTN|nr:TatD family hydrolase [Cutibacterium porci]MSS45181.1 TatD family deoxyribonuclease [Cutibacterium porci]